MSKHVLWNPANDGVQKTRTVGGVGDKGRRPMAVQLNLEGQRLCGARGPSVNYYERVRGN